MLFRSDSHGNIFTSQLVSLAPEPESMQKFEMDFPGIKWAWGDQTGKKLDRLPYPAPVLYFPKSGKPQSLMTNPGEYLRHQDIVYHDYLDKVYSTYSESNTIAVVDAKGSIENLHAKKFGIYKIRGIRTFSNSPLALINDSENGMALVNMERKRLIRFYDVPLFLTRHITLMPV